MSALLTAMIFAAGRGERMHPLSDACPKPLLNAGGKALIVWQIERLARAGFRDLVINHAWRGAQIEAALGDGARWGVRIRYSAEQPALETAGGIRQALPLLEARRGPCAFVAVSGDLYTDYDYRLLHAPLQRISQQPEPHLHLVMVPNPDHHPNGDFALLDNGQLSLIDAPRLTFGNIGVYHMHMFHTLAPGAHCALGPYYRTAIAARRASGEQYSGRWLNIGAPEQLYALDAMLSGVPHNRAGGVAPPCRTHCTVCVGAPCQRGCAKLLRHSCSEI
ncbi:Nucleotidyltransferase family protein (Glucose-1-phosphate thymidylyltransferase RfbA) [Candidatus Glomeribacter gigasporarum BEG34]|uniref:Nucleotidyltransferase family protein (Glucose-1-phosphate thymidylyltransferase RfbA) n=1 Tax=Candidatus Glomeribacter gigasporarum BEG34 TaxID=1070319 RepID=G2J9S9_9BURK|nr:Nucleotidyltransferase family protein (Glucose-1-phosphate thymidylyltransferase RfbA) [Candidatus Glomeribacter gigasporarum BEG34]